MADPQSGDIPDSEIERVVALLVKCFCDNKIAKPISGVAMIVLINRLENEGYKFELIPLGGPSDELH